MARLIKRRTTVETFAASEPEDDDLLTGLSDADDDLDGDDFEEDRTERRPSKKSAAPRRSVTAMRKKSLHRACITRVNAGDESIVVRVSVATDSEEQAKRIAREFARVVNSEQADPGREEDDPLRDY